MISSISRGPRKRRKVVVLDERLDLGLEGTGQKVIFQDDPFLQGLVPAFDFALGRRIGRAPNTWLIL